MVHSGDEERKKAPVVEVKPEGWVGNNIPESVPKDDVVTLTKSQLRAIFEAIGQVGALNINDKPTQFEKLCGNETDEQKKAVIATCSEVTTSQPNGSAHTSSSQVTCPLDLMLPSSSKVWSFSETQQQSTSQPQYSPSKSTLSKLEQKRLQWEREKAEIHDWNPWGKPGAGAPTRTSIPVASVAPRTGNQLLMVKPSLVPYSTPVPHSISSCVTSPSHGRSALNAADQCNTSQESPFHNKPFMSYNCVTQPVKPVPSVFKSSIDFGPAEDDYISEEILNRKQQFFKDLESQRDDQRLQHMRETDQFNSLGDADWNSSNKNDLDSISISVEGSGAPYIGGIPGDGRSHVRGQGFNKQLDPVSAAKAEERRQKAQEYQQAIRLQMEEKQRKTQEERARKKKEEEEEECRLAAERAQMQAEYEQEQRRLKQKMELEEKKQNAMLSAVREAQAQAEASRKSKKMQKLQPSPDDAPAESNNVAILNSPQKSNSIIDKPQVQSKNEEIKRRTDENAEAKTPQQTATVRPLQSQSQSEEFCYKDAGTVNAETVSREIGIQTVSVSSMPPEEYSGYITNRIITPPSHRVRARRSHAKDFGTQTDINYGKWIGDDAESTDHSNTSSIHPPVGKRMNRVQHSKPYKASRHHFGSDIDSAIDRPKWGANQPTKSFIRMTDRDPHFSKRKKLQELRKQHWEREMATQQALRNARRSNVASYPMLRNRRSRSSSEGTAGFSSSEFETNHNRHVSPSRYRQGYGYCSVCGSAEDIAYFRHSSTYSHLPSVRQRRDSQSSDNLPSIIGGSEPAPSRLTERFSFPDVPSSSSNLPPMRRKWHSQDAFCPHTLSYGRDPSPPVPALQKRLLSERTSSSLLSPTAHTGRRKWSDQESFDLESVALSHARSHKSTSEEGSDRNERDSISSAGSSKRGKTPTEQDPLVCPEVVTGRPTPRQDRILQNLSSLRQGLLLKQKELENLIRNPPDIS